ncbi:MAG: Clp protease N-terminal domain-containing protein [Chloroflexota bacterium]
MEALGLQDIMNLARQESTRLHHYFIGVEHLFVALTQLQGGLTAAVLESHGLSPRFVRYSIRESVGRYEDRRYWSGFPETPRAQKVLKMAHDYAGEGEPGERELLLAILDEGASIVSRVLHEVGADLAALRQAAAEWNAPLDAQAPEVPILGDAKLSDEQRRVLQLMFREYGQVQIVRELNGGYSGARVLLVRPVRVDGYKDAPVVAKLDDRYAVLYERRRYDLHVKGTLPSTTARLVDMPVVPDDLSIGGLKYTFVGHIEDTEPVNLREYALQSPPQAVAELIRALFESFGPAWWLQRKPYRFGAWREYEHALPPALVLEAVPESTANKGTRVIRPLGSWSRSSQILPGEVIAIEEFSVQKIDADKDRLHLAAGSQPEALNRASKVEIRGLGREAGHYRGEVIPRLCGRVVHTRDDLLRRSLQQLEPDFDFQGASIPCPLPGVADLPNPILHVNELLERQVAGYLSIIHGDLHAGNVLVGPRGDAWLIDFGWTREGHTLFDWAMLEVNLLVEVVARRARPGWAGAWDVIRLLRALNRGESLRGAGGDAALLEALGMIEAVREVVRECLAVPGHWREYFVALAFTGLRLTDWLSETIDGRRLAFLVAALGLAESLDPAHKGSTDSTWSELTADMDRTELRIDDQE